MSTGEFRDGSGISFVPRRRASTLAGRILAVVLLAAGSWALVTGLLDWQHSNPVRNAGVYAVGTMTGYLGLHATVSFDAGTTARTAVSVATVASADPERVGELYQVFYDPENPGRTFIVGVDRLEAPWPLLAAAAGSALLGAVFAARPPRTRARRRVSARDRA